MKINFNKLLINSSIITKNHSLELIFLVIILSHIPRKTLFSNMCKKQKGKRLNKNYCDGGYLSIELFSYGWQTQRYLVRAS